MTHATDMTLNIMELSVLRSALRTRINVAEAETGEQMSPDVTQLFTRLEDAITSLSVDDPNGIQLFNTFLVAGDPLNPSDTDTIAQIGAVSKREAIQSGWSVLDEHTKSFVVGRIIRRGDLS